MKTFKNASYSRLFIMKHLRMLESLRVVLAILLQVFDSK